MRVPNKVRAAGLAVIVAAAVAFAGNTAVRANPRPSLPSVSPSDLLASSLSALSQPFSVKGDATTQANLGLPDLPSSLTGTSSGPASILIGTQHFKIWRSPDGVRVARIVDFGEQDLVANSSDGWFWDSASMSAEHVALGRMSDRGAIDHAPAALCDPTALAKRVMTAIGPFAVVTEDGTARVAGRPVYQLTFTPRSTITRIGRVVVAIDSQTRLPLQIEVFARGAVKPALEAGFTKVSFGQVPASAFVFSPPPGAKVTQVTAPAHGEARPAAATAEGSPFSDAQVFGKGFDIRWAIKLSQPLPSEAAALLPYDGPLGSVMTAQHDGATWLLAGFVDLQTLRSDAGRLP
jgi:hypothetical protein